MKAIYGSVLVLVLFLLVGCGGGESLEKKVVGTWKVDTAKTEMSGEEVKDEADKKMMMAMMETVSLEIKEDKTFTMAFIFPIDGTWALQGNKLSLTPTKKPGENVSFGGKDKMEFDVDAGGASMSMEVTDEKMKGKLVMVKPEAAK